MSTRHRVLHLIYDDFKNRWLGGGGIFRTWEVYKRFTDEWELTVATGNYPGAISSEQIDNIRYLRLGSNRSYPASRVSFTYAARRLVKDSQCDLLVDDFSSYSPCLAAPYFRGPAVAIVQNLYGWHAVRHLGPLGFLSMYFEGRLFGIYRQFIPISPSIAEMCRARARTGSRVELIGHGVDERLLEVHDVREEPFLFFLGRIDVYQKGLDVLLKAFRRLSPEHPEVRLVFAGSGSDEQRLKDMIARQGSVSKQIEFIGRLDFEGKRDYLRRCLCLCAPSRFESWNLVVMEANACHRPVVGSRITGMTESVRDGETGILVPPEDADELYVALKRIITDSVLRQKMGESGWKFASGFSWGRTAEHQMSYYRELIGT